jgi:hypothetical protein
LVYDRIVESALFTFRIGKDENRKDFTVHAKAIAATSWYFRALVTNGMKESHTRTVDYTNVEPEDFVRFVEYAYRYDYTVPSWAHDETYVEDQMAPVPEVVPVEPYPNVPPAIPLFNPRYPSAFTNNESGSKKKRGKNNGGADSLPASFDKHNYLTSNEPKTTTLAAFEPQHNTAPDQDFTPVFLAHARLYTFACMRLVDPLKRLTLHKLHKTLLGFQLYERRVPDVIELARYAYKQGEERKNDGTKDELRQLVVEYMVREVTTFGKHEAFISLLQEGGEFVVDFWDLVYQEQL